MSGPSSTASQRLVIKSTAGAAAPETTNQAFTVAATAVAAGVEVSLWLTGDSAWLAVPGRAGDIALEHAAPMADLIETILESIGHPLELDRILGDERNYAGTSFVKASDFAHLHTAPSLHMPLHG